MIYYGFCEKDRCRIKWRCPRVLNKLPADKTCTHCSPSLYGRVVYTKPDWDERLFTRIPRGSDLFKEKMKMRTASERVNNRILHHYGIEHSKTRTKKRISFFVTMAAVNIHLDAQVQFLKAQGLFDFQKLFFSSSAD